VNKAILGLSNVQSEYDLKQDVPVLVNAHVAFLCEASFCVLENAMKVLPFVGLKASPWFLTSLEPIADQDKVRTHPLGVQLAKLDESAHLTIGLV